MNEPMLGNRARIAKRSIALIAICALVTVGAIYFVYPSSRRPQLLKKLSVEESEFQKFLLTHKKSYRDGVEYQHRLAVFKENLSFIRSENAKGHSYTLKANHFADLSFAEFKALYLSENMESNSQKVMSEAKLKEIDEENVSYPQSVDWISKGMVNEARDQGHCGSCWAFSTIASVESAAAIRGYGLHQYSEQHLVDCDTEYNGGCDGGWMETAFYFLMSHGTRLRSDYPYIYAQEYCKEDSYPADVYVNTYYRVKQNSAHAMLYCINESPLSIAVEANREWEFYSSGVFTAECGTLINHGVNIVGYDISGSLPYYVIRNSWSTGWGENGNMRILIEDGEGKCGTNMFGSFPTIA